MDRLADVDPMLLYLHAAARLSVPVIFAVSFFLVESHCPSCPACPLRLLFSGFD